jgi:valyl-tRNA synthetase
LDTWFSSWLWPISLFNGINNPGNEEINYYYPTADLVTGPDIIFFWVARMIMAGYEYQGTMPFKNVYFTGIVRDNLGRKMSKSLGNSPDPLDLIDRFGADGVRMGMMLSAPAGNDILFDESLCEQGRNFNNKIWNAFRLVKGWTVADMVQPESAARAIEWFESRLNQTLIEINDLFDKYRLSEALMAVYKLFWDDFSSWYLEMVKPAYQQPMDAATYAKTLDFFDALLRVLHPFMPFITEELWQALKERTAGESVMVALMPEIGAVNEDVIASFQKTQEIVAGIRTLRLQKNIPNKDSLVLQVLGEHNAVNNSLLVKMGNLSAIESVSEKEATAMSFMVGATEYAIPMADRIDVAAELKKMNEDVAYYERFLQQVMGKLNNERFVANAKPEIVEKERKKKADAEQKLAVLRDSIAKLSR